MFRLNTTFMLYYVILRFCKNKDNITYSVKRTVASSKHTKWRGIMSYRTEYCENCEKKLDNSYLNSISRLWTSQIFCKDCKVRIEKNVLIILSNSRKYLSAKQVAMHLKIDYNINASISSVVNAIKKLDVKTKESSHHKCYKVE